MNVDFSVTTPADWVKKALNDRSSNIISPGSNSWATQRTIWARVISGASLDGSDALRLSNVLWMGDVNHPEYKTSRGSTYDNSYESKINNRPTFGLDAIKVDFKGTMGSTKSCTISFKCWTLEQLEILEKLYMVPGISLIAEWGWSISTNGVGRVYPNGEFLTLNKEKDPYSKVMKSIISKRRDYDGNYDGIIGIITNFNYTLNENLGFDCQVEIVAPGEMWLEQNATNNSKKCGDDSNGKQEQQSNIQFAFHDLYRNHKDSDELKKINEVYPKSAPVAIVQEWETETREYDKHHRSTGVAIKETAAEWLGGSATRHREVYVSWQFFVTLLNENIGLFDGKVTFNGPKKNKGGKVELAMDLIPISVLPKFYSLDPTICTFKPINIDIQNAKRRENEIAIAYDREITVAEKDGLKTETPVEPGVWTSLGNTIVGAWNRTSNFITDSLENDDQIRECEPLNGLPDIIGNGALDFAKKQINELGNEKDIESLNENDKFILDDNVGLLNCIFLNAGFLRDCVSTSAGESLTIQEYLTKVLGDLNTATGNIWNLQYHIDENDSSRVRIYDANYTSIESRKDLVEPYNFKLLTDHTLVIRGATVESKLVDGFKSMVLYGNNSEDNGNNDTANQGMQLYSNKIIDAWREAAQQTEQHPEYCINSEGKIVRSTLTPNPEADLDYNYMLLLRAADPETVSSAKNAMQQYITWLNKNNPEVAKRFPMNQNILLPFNFGITIDGFSGFVWGNAINFDYLPTRYNDRIYFQVTKISHDISVSDWTTTIETVMRLRNEESTSSGTNLSIASTAKIDTAGKQLIQDQSPNGPVQSQTTYGAESTGTDTAKKAAMYSGLSKNQIDPNDPRNNQDISGFF